MWIKHSIISVMYVYTSKEFNHQSHFRSGWCHPTHPLCIHPCELYVASTLNIPQCPAKSGVHPLHHPGCLYHDALLWRKSDGQTRGMRAVHHKLAQRTFYVSTENIRHSGYNMLILIHHISICPNEVIIVLYFEFCFHFSLVSVGFQYGFVPFSLHLSFENVQF